MTRSRPIGGVHSSPFARASFQMRDGVMGHALAGGRRLRDHRPAGASGAVEQIRQGPDVALDDDPRMNPQLGRERRAA